MAGTAAILASGEVFEKVITIAKDVDSSWKFECVETIEILESCFRRERDL